ncbi:hypothetical protein DFH09DRAFT_1166784 [Mycena vulgaris]|nr:hypothetical protein DFH09DRAFT_1166784 [Mycena vulgaris]
MRCPTIARIFKAFNRDLEMVTHTVWAQHRKLVLKELKFLQEGIFPSGTAVRRNDKIRCSSCPRLVRLTNMAEHILDAHMERDTDPNAISRPREAREKHCPECPRSTRVYTGRGLKDHQLSKHSRPLCI